MKNVITLIILFALHSLVCGGLINGLPADGLVAWLDASDITGLSQGDPVAIWPMKSSMEGVDNMVDWNLTDAYAPVYHSSQSGFNGKPSLYFSANVRDNDYLVSQNMFANYLSGHSLTIFFVSQSRYLGVVNYIAPRVFCAGHSLTFGSGTASTLNLASVATTAIRTYTIDAINKEAKGWLNGELKNTLDLSSRPDSDFIYGSSRGLRIGAAGTGTNYAGYMAEIIIYNRELDDVEINAVGYYLAAKYDIVDAMGQGKFTEPGPIRTLTVSNNISAEDVTNPPAGQYQYLNGQLAVLTANELYWSCPDVYEFSNWLGDPNNLLETRIRMFEDRTAVANYVLSTTKNCVTLTIDAPEGTTTPAAGSYNLAPDVEMSIEAVGQYADCPKVYGFTGWSGEGIAEPASAATTVTVNTDKTVKAVYNDISVCGDECHPYPLMDFNSDCVVDMKDFASFASQWLVDTYPND